MLKYNFNSSYTARNYGISTIDKQISILQPLAMQASLRPTYIGINHRKDYCNLNENLQTLKDKMQASLRPTYIGINHRKDYCNLDENLQTITMTVSNYEPRCINKTYIIINLKIK